MDQEVTAGSTALLRCRFTDSNPPAVLNWKKDGHPIIPDNERVILSPSGYLYIRDVSQADAGLYQCLADNIVSEARRRTNETLLTVSGKTAGCGWMIMYIHSYNVHVLYTMYTVYM